MTTTVATDRETKTNDRLCAEVSTSLSVRFAMRGN